MSKIEVAAVFSDNMVLQRGKNINIFGWLDKNSDEVFVEAQLFDNKGNIIGENAGIYHYHERSEAPRLSSAL